jgi:hypothetical protein
MPETSVNKDHFPARPEHQVGFSGKIFSMQPESVAQFVHEASHLQLWQHILAADRPHIGAPVHQRSSGDTGVPLSNTRETWSGLQKMNRVIC